MGKTNATRLLEQQKVKFETVEYKSKDDEIDAISVANKINEIPERVFKTLVSRGDKNGECVFVIPGDKDLNMKKAANVSGNKKVELIKLKELQPLTGYIRGGCSPVGMKKSFPTYIHESALEFETMFCSAGKRGIQLKIKPEDLKNTVNGEFADLV